MKVYNADDWHNEIPPSEEFLLVEKARGYTAWCNRKAITKEKPFDPHHRVDGPARIWEDGSKEWYIYGKSHRLDGPAVIDTVSGTIHWYINGNRVNSYDEFQDLTGCSDEDIVAYKLKWGEINGS
jgi:hypothetical protein